MNGYARLILSIRALALLGLLLAASSPVRAAPSQQDVFKSIQDSMGQPTQFDSRPMLLLAAAAGLLGLLVLVNNRGRRTTRGATGPVNSRGKLVKEVLRHVPLKSAEMKQLKLLADAIEPPPGGQDLNPLTLLLCPSLMVKGLQASPGKVDKKVVAQVVRKLRSAPPGSGAGT